MSGIVDSGPGSGHGNIDANDRCCHERRKDSAPHNLTLEPISGAQFGALMT
jgi:hypothetical protein